MTTHRPTPARTGRDLARVASPQPARTAAKAGRERGSMSVELAVLAPVLLLLLVLVIAAGRVGKVHTTLDSAAQSTARAASLARTPGQAHADANTVAAQSMTQSGLTCTAQTIDVDTTGFAATLGQPATVRATISCTVPLGDLSIPGLPGTRTLTATAASPLDPYRERR